MSNLAKYLRTAKRSKPRKISYAQKSRQGDFYASTYELPGRFYPIRADSGMNAREHWSKRQRRAKKERADGVLMGKLLARYDKPPFTITFTRYSVGMLDSDALPNPFKSYRDGIADAFGVTDGPGGPIKWEYKQEKCPRGCYGFRVEVKPNI